MDTLIEGFKLMRNHPINILKMIYYQMLPLFLNFIIFRLSFRFTSIFLILILTTPFHIIFIFCGYERLFTSEKSNTFLTLLQYSFYRFKKYGWRVLSVNIVSFLFICLLIKLIIYMGFAWKDILTPKNEIFTPNQNAFTVMGENLTILTGVFFVLTPILTAVRFFLKYTYISFSLGYQNAIKSSFRQWRNIVLGALISSGFFLTTLIGLLGFISFNFAIPLKIILDIQKQISKFE